MPPALAEATIGALAARNRQARQTRASDPGPEPRKHMSNEKRAFMLAAAGVLDVLKFCCAFLFWAIGPVIVGYLTAYETGKYVPGWIADAIGFVVGAGTGVAAPEFYIGLGVIFAIIIGFVGWVLFILILLLTGSISLTDSEGLQVAIAIFIGFAVSEMPLVDAFPTFTPSIWRITSVIHKADTKKHATWQANCDAWLKQQQEERAAYVAQVQQAYALQQAQFEQDGSDEGSGETQESIESPYFSNSEALGEQEIPEEMRRLAERPSMPLPFDLRPTRSTEIETPRTPQRVVFGGKEVDSASLTAYQRLSAITPVEHAMVLEKQREKEETERAANIEIEARGVGNLAHQHSSFIVHDIIDAKWKPSANNQVIDTKKMEWSDQFEILASKSPIISASSVRIGSNDETFGKNAWGVFLAGGTVAAGSTQDLGSIATGVETRDFSSKFGTLDSINNAMSKKGSSYNELLVKAPEIAGAYFRPLEGIELKPEMSLQNTRERGFDGWWDTMKNLQERKVPVFVLTKDNHAHRVYDIDLTNRTFKVALDTEVTPEGMSKMFGGTYGKNISGTSLAETMAMRQESRFQKAP